MAPVNATNGRTAHARGAAPGQLLAFLPQAPKFPPQTCATCSRAAQRGQHKTLAIVRRMHADRGAPLRWTSTGCCCSTRWNRPRRAGQPQSLRWQSIHATITPSPRAPLLQR
eukprot:6199955-Pleurochrysis_carterae.AAC.1